VKRFAQVDGPSHPVWPDPDENVGSHLFAPRPAFRKLVVMIDAELLTDVRSTPLAKDELLSDLLESRLIDLYRYADDGPPATVAPTPAPLPGWATSHKGWVVVTDADPVAEIWGVIYEDDVGNWVQGAVAGNAVTIAAEDARCSAFSTLGPAAASDRRRADGLAAQVASQVLQADLYITIREYLHTASWGVARGVATCRPEEALPLVGLYLRAQGSFLISTKFRFNRGLYFWVGTRELLPAAWRWFTACVQHDGTSNAHDLTSLGQSLLQRVERALEARDRIHLALNQPQHNDTRREVLAALDEVLVDLMGAVDAAARVVHRVLGFAADREFGAAWQKDAWLAQVKKQAAPLALVTAPGTSGLAALTILRRLRNSVHGTALQAMALITAGVREEQSIIGIPPDDTEVLDAMDQLGGREAWGARPVLADHVHIDAGVFVDTLFPHVLELLNELMSHTPVEQLANVSLKPQDCQPPPDDPRNTGAWDEWVRTSIRWQLGL